MSSLMTDEAKRSITREKLGDVHCNHCQHEGPTRIERSGPVHFIIAILLLVFGVMLWPLLPVGLIWLIYALANKKRHVCIQCNSTDYIEIDR